VHRVALSKGRDRQKRGDSSFWQRGAWGGHDKDIKTA